jgi:hypothetical protein
MRATCIFSFVSSDRGTVGWCDNFVSTRTCTRYTPSRRRRERWRQPVLIFQFSTSVYSKSRHYMVVFFRTDAARVIRYSLSSTSFSPRDESDCPDCLGLRLLPSSAVPSIKQTSATRNAKSPITISSCICMIHRLLLSAGRNGETNTALFEQATAHSVILTAYEYPAPFTVLGACQHSGLHTSPASGNSWLWSLACQSFYVPLSFSFQEPNLPLLSSATQNGQSIQQKPRVRIIHGVDSKSS